jgi:hypothetical protein
MGPYRSSSDSLGDDADSDPKRQERLEKYVEQRIGMCRALVARVSKISCRLDGVIQELEQVPRDTLLIHGGREIVDEIGSLKDIRNELDRVVFRIAAIGASTK